MPEYRQDPLTGRMVIVAEERASRPHQFDIEDSDATVDAARNHCPFCEGNEDRTPGELAVFRSAASRPDSPGWTVRVVPNKFPAVVRQDAAYPDASGFQDRFRRHLDLPSEYGNLSAPVENDFFSPIPGVGHHEVIVDTPRHVLSVSDMSDAEVGAMFRMYRERLRFLRSERRWACVQIFKNVGAAAGASIPHAHSQLIAMPFVPPSFRSLLKRAGEYRAGSSCFWCEMLAFERREQTRIVEETDRFTALCPFASRFTAEVELYPNTHEASLEEIDAEETLAEFAALVRRTVIRLEKAVSWMKGQLAYNFVLHTEPFEMPCSDRPGRFHWHLSILPSLARAAGFEWGTGLHINPIPPEYAARQLRREIGDQDG